MILTLAAVAGFVGCTDAPTPNRRFFGWQAAVDLDGVPVVSSTKKESTAAKAAELNSAMVIGGDRWRTIYLPKAVAISIYREVMGATLKFMMKKGQRSARTQNLGGGNGDCIFCSHICSKLAAVT